MLEPIQGEVELCLLPMVISSVAQLCEKENILLILDEVQTGFAEPARCLLFNITELDQIF